MLDVEQTHVDIADRVAVITEQTNPGIAYLANDLYTGGASVSNTIGVTARSGKCYDLLVVGPSSYYDVDVGVYLPTTGLVLKGFKDPIANVEGGLESSAMHFWAIGDVADVASMVRTHRGGTCAAVKARAEKPSKGVIVNLDPTLHRSLETQRARLKKLNDNWDGYGATPLRPDMVDGLVDELRAALTDYAGPLPDLIPGADGTLQVEWHLKDLELIYGIDSDDQRYFHLTVGDAEQSSYGSKATVDLATALAVHFRGGDDQSAYGTALW